MTAEIIQGSPEWYAVRLGKVTASRIADLTAKTKTGWGASRANYMAELLVERLTGEVAPSYTNDAMRWGLEKEPEARAAYEWHRDCEIKPIGFVHHPHINMSGASPDGQVADDGMVEIKCPNTATHIDTLLSDAVAEKYIKQMQWQMACAERQWCDFVSFDPRLPEHMRLFVKRIEFDKATVAILEKDVMAFLFELDEKIEALAARYPQPVNMLATG